MQQKVLLVEPDFPVPQKSKNHAKFLPLPLLKHARYHEVQGDKVELVRGNEKVNFKPDMIKITSLFTYWHEHVFDSIRYYQHLYPNAKIQVGGIYASLMPEHLRSNFPDVTVFEGIDEELDHIGPDYKWVNVDYQIVHASRGCFRKCPFCVTPGTLVFTNPSFLPIELIQIGEEIMGTGSQQHVLETFERDYSGKLVELKAIYFPPVKITPEHEFLVARAEFKYPKISQNRYTMRRVAGTLTWKKAIDMEEVHQGKSGGDFLVVPKLKTKETVVDFSSYIKQHNKRVLNWMCVPVQLNKELSELFGWYVAEGHVSKEVTILSLGKHEHKNLKRIDELAQKLGLSYFTREAQTEIQLFFTSRVFSRAVKDWFGTGAKNKRVPRFLLEANRRMIGAFLRGYITGDGCFLRDGKIRVVTVSPVLARQLCLIGLKIGVPFSIVRRKINKGMIGGRKLKESEQFSLESNGGPMHHYIEGNDFYFLQLRRKRILDYSGKVYNLRTSEGIYLLPFIVHNCGVSKIEPKITYKTWPELKREIIKNKLVFYDNNILDNPNITAILEGISNTKVNGKVIHCEAQSGFDPRLMTPELAKLIKKARFSSIRISWDWGLEQEPIVRRALECLNEAGYDYKHISVFMIYNWDIPFEVLEQKRDICKRWNVQITDCRYRPLDQLYDNYKPFKPQTKDDYYIHSYWTDEQIKTFRREVREQNICIRFGFQDIQHYKDWIKHRLKTKPLINNGLFNKNLKADF